MLSSAIFIPSNGFLEPHLAIEVEKMLRWAVRGFLNLDFFSFSLTNILEATFSALDLSQS